MRRSRLLASLAFVTLVLATLAAADFVKAGRQAPEMTSPGERADRLLVEKSKRLLTLFRDGSLIRSYRIALGSSPIGDKEHQGDSRTPTGRYVIDFKNARSAFHLSLRVSYPDASDRDAARRLGADPGGDIMIHGLPNGLGAIGPLHRLMDWTDGCIAVTNAEIKEIWAMTGVGTEIEIRE